MKKSLYQERRVPLTFKEVLEARIDSHDRGFSEPTCEKIATSMNLLPILIKNYEESPDAKTRYKLQSRACRIADRLCDGTTTAVITTKNTVYVLGCDRQGQYRTPCMSIFELDKITTPTGTSLSLADLRKHPIFKKLFESDTSILKQYIETYTKEKKI